jgi:hypothetical protein
MKYAKYQRLYLEGALTHVEDMFIKYRKETYAAFGCRGLTFKLFEVGVME